MYTKSMPYEIKADVNKREFEAYASTYKKDLVGDQIVAGAFKKTIAERFPQGKIKILWQHDAPLGKPLEMYEDSKGLFVRGYIAKTSLGDDALELARSGIVSEMSIGYDVIKDSLSDDGGTRLLHELKLYEVSMVTFGANPDTSINSVKSLSLLNELQPQRLAMLLKEGRSVSQRNLDRLLTARNSIDEIIKLVANDEPDKSTGSQPLTTTQSEEENAIKTLSELISEYKNIGKGLKK